MRRRPQPYVSPLDPSRWDGAVWQGSFRVSPDDMQMGCAARMDVHDKLNRWVREKEWGADYWSAEGEPAED